MNARHIFPLVASLPLLLDVQSSAHAAYKGHTVLKVFLDSGNPGTQLTQASTLINSTTVVCPTNLASCTISLLVMDNVCNNYGGEVFFKANVTVDGVSLDGNDYTGYVWGDTCGGGVWSSSYAVTPGRHNVQLFTAFQTAVPDMSQGLWSVSYTVTAP
jgi:hypothetical protein